MWFKIQFKHLLLKLQAKYMAFHVLGALSQPLGTSRGFPTFYGEKHSPKQL